MATTSLRIANRESVPVSADGVLRRACRMSALLCLAGLAALAVDMPVSSAGRGLLGTSPCSHLWELCELFGDGLGAMLIVLVIFLVYKAGRRLVPRVMICALGAGLAANVVKLVVVRARPRAFDLGEGVLQSFHGLRLGVAMHDSGAVWDSSLQSFPSGHAATAAGLAVGLAWLFPRARLVVVVLTALVMCQRIVVGAHFLSDTLAGAAVGCVLAACCLDRRCLAPRLDAYEARLRDALWKAGRPQASTSPGAAPRARPSRRCARR